MLINIDLIILLHFLPKVNKWHTPSVIITNCLQLQKKPLPEPVRQGRNLIQHFMVAVLYKLRHLIQMLLDEFLQLLAAADSAGPIHNQNS